jgi:hypothetical protein
LPFREDILRGVRLFAIVFAAILLCVAGYRILKPPADVQGATPAPPEVAQPSPASSEPAPVSDAAAEAHPLIVPGPPPSPGAPVGNKLVKKVVRPRVADPGVPPPPPIAHSGRTPAPTARRFEPSNALAFPSAPVEDSSETPQPAPKQAVGYKSLIEADPNRPPAEVASPAPPAPESAEKPAKGNRFFRAVGKIFHPGAKKETMPLTLQPKQQ